MDRHMRVVSIAMVGGLHILACAAGGGTGSTSSSGTGAGSTTSSTGGGSSSGTSGGSSGTPSGMMGFFVTSVGTGANGGNLGGLTGADAICQNLAQAAGAGGKTWHAYLSTSAITDVGPRVDARDRIGNGPWFDFTGALVAPNVASLHSNGIATARMLTETGATVPVSEHDILTGSQADGTAFDSFPGNPGAPGPTCLNWTSSSGEQYAYVGHHDWEGGSGTWNFAHETTCSETGLASTSGSGRLYCFAIN